jgi:hypothetical protein
MRNNGVKIVLERDFKSKFISRVHSIGDTNKNTMYSSSFNSKRSYLNFINTYFGDYYDETLKSLIEKVVLELETIAPGTSDLFLDILTTYYKDNISVSEYLKSNFENRVLRLERNDLAILSQNIENAISKKIIENVIAIMEYDDQIFIDNSTRDLTLIKKTNQLFFNVKFDKDFLIPFGGKWERDNFKFIVIDGFIDSAGEIHHLLHKASEDKEPYVVFCKGMREEVKHTILHNLQRKTIDVLPISLETNEENVNILNDIASCLDSDVISALKGDLISVEVRRELSVGKKIRINRKGFYLNFQNEKKVRRQLLYLKNKIKKINPDDPNFNYLEKRIKTLEAKKIEIFLSKDRNKKIKTDLDYFLKLVANAKSGIVKIKTSNCKKDLRSFYSASELNIIFKKVSSLIKTIENLGCIVYKEKK